MKGKLYLDPATGATVYDPHADRNVRVARSADERRAYDQGYIAGGYSHAMNVNPYPPGSSLFDQWGDGWDDGYYGWAD